jgi:hypothetical protein
MSTRILLFDGTEQGADGTEKGAQQRNEARLKFLQNGDLSRIDFVLNQEGNKVKKAAGFGSALSNLSTPTLFFVHTSQCLPNFLAKKLSETESSMPWFFVLYSGAGVPAELAAPLLEEGVLSKIIGVGQIEPPLDQVSAVDLAELMDVWRHSTGNAFSTEKDTLLKQMRLLLDRVNSPFKATATALHILASLVCAANHVDPKTDQRFPGLSNFSFRKIGEESLSASWWKDHLGIDLSKVMEQLKKEGVSFNPVIAGLDAFVSTSDATASVDLFLAVWKQLDTHLTGAKHDSK